MQLGASVKIITLQQLAELIDDHKCESFELENVGVIHKLFIDNQSFSVFPSPNDELFVLAKN